MTSPVRTVRTMSTPVRRWDLSLEVGRVAPLEGRQTLGGWLYAPEPSVVTPDATLFVCHTGGRCTTRYFDLQPDGFTDYSMARYLAERGAFVLAFDHLGLGASNRLEDICLVTPAVEVRAQQYAVGAVIDRLQRGDLIAGLDAVALSLVVGVGHSMGGMLVTVEQAAYQTYDAICVLGHGGDGTPDALTDDERALGGMGEDRRDRVLVSLAQARARRVRGKADAAPQSRASRPSPGLFFTAEVPRPVRAAFISDQTELLYSCALATMVPGYTDDHKARIEVPVLLVFGDQDLTDAYDASAAGYASSTEVTMFVLPDSAHLHNVASTRTVLWDQLLQWAQDVRQRR
jgi:pimeloyl-ACP methyl ester carboxylesterase